MSSLNDLSFIRAERTGGWNLHKDTFREFLPIYHAAGHLPYAKAGHTYLQEMERLENALSDEDFKKFTDEGYFTIRRSHKFWAGVWTDMTIEQMVMRCFKARGGCTRGRGVTDSTLAYFVGALPHCNPMFEALE